MRWKSASRQTRLYLIASFVLAAGLGSSLSIYLAAGDVSDAVSGYGIEETKPYIHDLELYGGKANVIAAEITKWFEGLWHGKSLAYTVAFITIIASMALFFVAYHLPSESGPDDRNRNGRGGSY